jgi:hypothetical protein
MKGHGQIEINAQSRLICIKLLYVHYILALNIVRNNCTLVFFVHCKDHRNV